MKNIELQFKTNLNCGGCVSKVKADLDQAQGITHWDVDTTQVDKILTVSASGITPEEVMEIVSRKGFKIESVSH